MDRPDAIAGAVLGTAVGDALGLPREGISRRRAARMFGDGPVRHRFVLGRGMISDDTEHACMTAQALLRAPADDSLFARSLAWRLRLWIIGLPAGIGLATLRSLVKLWVGFPPDKSGVRSAGNGPAMRAPILGVCLGGDLNRLRAFVRASTRMTHTDPKALRGAMLAAFAAHYGAARGPAGVDHRAFLDAVPEALDLDDDLHGLLAKLKEHLDRGATAVEFADAIGCDRGVSGYIYHTVPAALCCWLRSPGDFRRSMEDVLALGGDADTTGAILGGIAGATVGASGIPKEWVDGIADWPRSVPWMRSLASRLVETFPDASAPASSSPGPLPLFWPGLLPRNALFLLVVLLHGFRRLLPPY